MTDKRITGVMIYYYFVCKRKLWYFCHEINMESENENVQLGKLLDEKSYERRIFVFFLKNAVPVPDHDG